MKSFDIHINLEGKTVSLTIQPEEAGTYKVIYHGTLVGEITMGNTGENWEVIPIDQVNPGIFPMYEHDAAKSTGRITLDPETVQNIGKEISVNVK